jgi:hypothetical protein
MTAVEAVHHNAWAAAFVSSSALVWQTIRAIAPNTETGQVRLFVCWANGVGPAVAGATPHPTQPARTRANGNGNATKGLTAKQGEEQRQRRTRR